MRRVCLFMLTALLLAAWSGCSQAPPQPTAEEAAKAPPLPEPQGMSPAPKSPAQ